MIVNEPKFPHTVLQLFMITAKVPLSQFEKILITGSIQTGKFFTDFLGDTSWLLNISRANFI